jgi:ADP-ribose pyrophosphatase YjhB (NUDIX family)
MKNTWHWIVLEDKRILLVKRSKNETKLANFWSVPWWKQDENESVEETVIRELKEEVWVVFKADKLFSEYSIETRHFYNFIWIRIGKIILDESESDGYWWFNYEETKSLLIPNDIKENIIEKLFEEGLIS